MSLFDPFDLRGLKLPNRIVMAPMTRSRAPTEVADDLTALYYRQRASAGLIVTEGVPISREAIGYALVPGLYTDEQVQGWRKVTSAVHEAGGRIFTQLWHVGRVSHTSLQEGGAAPVSSTDQPATGPRTFAYGWTDEGVLGFVAPSKPRRLETEELARVVADYAAAAQRALDAGFDGVELHCAHGYLVEQFLNPQVNDRTDAYGGRIDGRTRLLLEIVDAVAAVVGADKLGVRISPLAAILGAEPYEGNEATYLRVLAEFETRKIAYVHLSDTGGLRMGGTPAMSDGFLRRARKLFSGAIVLAGGMEKERAERLIDEGVIDLAAFGVPFISNPDLVERLRGDLPLTPPDRDTFYGGAEAGYTDYPTYAPV